MKQYLYRLATDQNNSLLAKILKIFLLLLSLIYGAVVKLIHFGYAIKLCRQRRLPKPVISVGNITWGGTGKTPLAVFIAEHLKKQGLKPAILTRGYMAHGAKSDEAITLKETLGNIPVFVGANRFEVAQEALAHNPIDVFILDDGFQHRRLKRDLDIVVIDSTKPFGNGCLIPRGILREPVSHLKRAHISVLTKVNLGQQNVQSIKKQLNKVCPNALIVKSCHQPTALMDINGQYAHDLSFLKGRPVCAFCGIGDPVSFKQSLVNVGAQVKKIFTFMDHHVYTQKDIEGVFSYGHKHHVSTFITTHKDMVKVRPHLDQFADYGQLFYLEIKVQITKQQNKFLDGISTVFNN